MAKLSLGQAWNETAAFVKREAGLLFPIALLLVALPMAAVRLLAPVTDRPDQLPEPGLWLAALPVATILGMVGNLAVSTLALRPGTSVGEALANGLRRTPALLGATLLFGLAVGLAALIVMTVFAFLMLGADANPTPQAALGAASASLVVLLPAALYLFARFLLVTPVAAAEKAGPVAILARSWRLSAASVWSLIGFLLLLLLLFLVVSLAAGAVFGLVIIAISGPPDPGSISALLILLVGALINMVISVYMTVMVARIYAQLAGGAAPTPISGS